MLMNMYNVQVFMQLGMYVCVCGSVCMHILYTLMNTIITFPLYLIIPIMLDYSITYFCRVRFSACFHGPAPLFFILISNLLY